MCSTTLAQPNRIDTARHVGGRHRRSQSNECQSLPPARRWQTRDYSQHHSLPTWRRCPRWSQLLDAEMLKDPEKWPGRDPDLGMLSRHDEMSSRESVIQLASCPTFDWPFVGHFDLEILIVRNQSEIVIIASNLHFARLHRFIFAETMDQVHRQLVSRMRYPRVACFYPTTQMKVDPLPFGT